MSARAARRASRQTGANRHQHSHPPSREELRRQVERQQREIEQLREQVAERDRRIADAEKQIADLERQLALRQQNSTNSSKPPSSDGLAGEPRQRGRRKKSRRKVGGHLKRTLLGIVEFTKNSAVERFCRDALAEHAKLFRLWHKFRGGQIDRAQLLLRSIPIQQRIFALAQRHLDSSHREVGNLATALFKPNQRLFTFLEQEGVEPTNNSAERALRAGVQWRKICFGNRSANGEIATARLLTVAETCDLQRLNILGYLSAAITCHRRRQQVASLLTRSVPN